MSEEITSPYQAPLSTEVTPTFGKMHKRLTNIGVLKAGIFLAVLYAAFGLLFALIYAPIMMVAASMGMSELGGGAAMMGGLGLGMIIVIPLFYAVMVFIGGVIGSALYNLVSKWTGGLEFTLEDA